MIHVLKLASNSIASKPVEKHNRNLMTWPNWNGVLVKQEMILQLKVTETAINVENGLLTQRWRAVHADYALYRDSWRLKIRENSN